MEFSKILLLGKVIDSKCNITKRKDFDDYYGGAIDVLKTRKSYENKTYMPTDKNINKLKKLSKDC